MYPDSNGLVRNVAVSLPVPTMLDGTTEYKKGAVMNVLKRHVSNLIVIVPSEENGHGAECESVV